MNTNISSARPITELDMSSHELRFNWDNGGNVAATLGLYASKTEDSQHDMTIFAPVCGDRDVNGNGTADDERANCEVSYRDGVDNTPLNDVVFNPFFLFAREYWHGNQGNLTDFEDEMRAAFATVEWAFND